MKPNTEIKMHAVGARGVSDPALLVPEPEARRMLGGLSLKTMYNFRLRGLPFVKIGSRVMYSPADLAAWIERQKGS